MESKQQPITTEATQEVALTVEKATGEATSTPPTKRIGRPKGSKNKPKRGRPRTRNVKRKASLNFSSGESIQKEEPPQQVQDKSDFIHTGAELLKLGVDTMPCVLGEILQKVGLAALAGSSDSGKSSFLRDLSTAISIKQDEFLGWRIKAKHNSVIYVSTEDDKYSIAYLLNKQNADRGLDEDSYNSLRYIFDTDNLLTKLEDALTKQPADLIVIDAFTDLFIGSINDSNQVRSFLNNYNLLAQKHECLIIFLHHTGKRTDDLTPSKHNLLGSQGFEAKMRVVIELRKDRKDPSLRHLCIVKGNYLSEEQKRSSYVLKFSENMTFSNTGQRVQLENLRQNTEQDAKIRQVRELSEQGYTQQQIADKVGFANKSSVSRLLGKSKSTSLSNNESEPSTED